jgi:hypothetical protein
VAIRGKIHISIFAWSTELFYNIYEIGVTPGRANTVYGAFYLPHAMTNRR